MKGILQVFKKLLHRKVKVYVCDPAKNKACSKDGCWDIRKGPCKCTEKKQYSKLDSSGKPIIATDDDLCNMEWLDYYIREQMES